MLVPLKEALKNIEIFTSLSEPQTDYLVKNSKLVEADKKESIHRQGELCTNLSVVIDGEICGIKYSSTGKEQVLAYYGPSECFGGILIFNEEKYPASLIAEEKSLVLEIPKKVVFQLFDNKEFLQVFLRDMSRKIVNLSDIIEVLVHTSVKSRVARYILKEVEKQGSSTIKLHKSKTVIAKELGSVREVVSRVFKTFENKGIIRGDKCGNICVLNITELEKEYMK